MFEIPLFPLNTVLFPGMPLALHIFEERYKLMIGKCIEGRRPFGVALIKEGIEALGPVAEPHTIGCTAHITEVEQLEEGRMNIGAIGQQRFRIVSLNHDFPYLVGQVEAYPLDEQEPEAQADAARRLRPWVMRYMEELSRFEGIELNPEEVPDEPVTLAYLAAALLQVPAEQKQRLLAMKQAAELLTAMRGFYRQEIAFLRSMLDQQMDDLDSFSLN